jgi:hypothetical protein
MMTFSYIKGTYKCTANGSTLPQLFIQPPVEMDSNPAAAAATSDSERSFAARHLPSSFSSRPRRTDPDLLARRQRSRETCRRRKVMTKALIVVGDDARCVGVSQSELNQVMERVWSYVKGARYGLFASQDLIELKMFEQLECLGYIRRMSFPSPLLLSVYSPLPVTAPHHSAPAAVAPRIDAATVAPAAAPPVIQLDDSSDDSEMDPVLQDDDAEAQFRSDLQRAMDLSYRESVAAAEAAKAEEARSASAEARSAAAKAEEALSAGAKAPAAVEQAPRAQEQTSSMGKCMTCLEETANVALIECGHVALCKACIGAWRTKTPRPSGEARTAKYPPCPICRAPVRSILILHPAGM